MSWDTRSFMPNRISGQIAILIVASLVVIHIVLTAAFFINRRGPPPERAHDELATLIELIAASPGKNRVALVRRMANAFPRFELALAAVVPDAGPHAIDDSECARFAHRLGPDYRVVSLETHAPVASGAGRRIAIRLPDGQFVAARLSPMPFPLFGPVTITLLAIAISVTLLGLWAARGLTGPLRRFAWTAENFSPSDEIALLPERGPYEIRAAARALNRMRERVKSLLEERTRMLAAVSHDLRTPLTRLRLRCEFIEDQTGRAQILDELARMNAMVESILHFLRDGQTREKASMIDLATSLQTICDQFADMGHNVGYDGPDHIVVHGHAEELHRAITNLVDNAVRHGGKTNVRVSLTSPLVTIAIEDDGPGIPSTDKETMFEPFVRGDAARGMNDRTGFGLGLSIARTVIEAHGGTLTLVDREPHGLVARITLPQIDAKSDATGAGQAH